MPRNERSRMRGAMSGAMTVVTTPPSPADFTSRTDTDGRGVSDPRDGGGATQAPQTGGRSRPGTTLQPCPRGPTGGR